VLILAGDHIYKMNYEKFILHHIETGADLTVGCVRAPREKARVYGVVAADAGGRITGFLEKPENPPPIPGEKNVSYVSMGIYVFSTKELVRAVARDAKTDSKHDFGHDIIPMMVSDKKSVHAYNFIDENRKDSAYWRDIGDIDSYYEANMDLCEVNPLFNLYDKDWPIHTYLEPFPPTKTVFADDYEGGRVGKALDSLVSPGVRINSYASVENSVLFHGVEIGRRCRIRRAIIDKDVRLPQGTVLGFNAEEDAKLFTVSPGGIVVIPKGHKF
jgi:glucose-1-phosphate adenylyltransferase